MTTDLHIILSITGYMLGGIGLALLVAAAYEKAWEPKEDER